MKFHSERFSLPVFPRRVIAAAVFALCSNHALAVEPFEVKDIRVEGIQRTEAGTVFSYLPVKVGETYTDEKGVAAIKALYATGLFKDVRVEVEGNVLVVAVEERPTIASVAFTGLKEFEKDALIKGLKEIGVGETHIFDKSLVERAEQELKRQYLSHGLYGVQVTTTVTPIERNRVNVTFAVDEGDAAHIKQIKFVGNKAFSDSDLLKNIKLTTPGWFTWYTKSDQYSKQKLSGDLETLKSFYLDRGYLEMQIESTQVSITTDKKDIYITINITEGDKYTVSDIKMDGEMLGREAELQNLMLLKKGEVYSGKKLTDSIKRISDRMGNFGYAFANVNANPEIDHEKKLVAFTMLVDPGKRVYVRHINISGNTRTRDEVIRREFRQYEASWYDNDKIKRSRDRVERLDYFKEVTVETPEVVGSTDQIDVNLAVTEKPTGNITLGAGYSQYEHLTLNGGISQANAFGSGDTIGVQVNTSALNRTIVLSHTDPYVTDEGISRTVQLYMRTTRPPLTNTGDFNVRTTGSTVNFGVPFTEFDRVFFGIGVEHTDVETYKNDPGYNDSPLLYQEYVQQFGSGDEARTTSFPLTVSWARDSRDSAITPTVGQMQRANLELAAFGTLRYYRAIYQSQYFRPLASWVTLALNGEFDYGRGLGDKPYPVFKNFYAGGIGSVRGYLTGTLGPLDVNGDPLGGASRVIMNAELQFPFPGASKDAGLRWFTFLDGGNVFADRAKVDFSELRYSAGIGISWISPVGPLKLSYGEPLNAQPTDQKERFQFQMGTGF
ncbi:MAG: outer membrane protein assembly factor BamA [Burkholderiaceae bacterium]|nr:outer membrane protein assembly factor BamA [Burkholderiaceae bacterium]